MTQKTVRNATATRKTALVTGGSRGIGRAIAHELGKDHHILVGGTSPDTVADAVQSLPSAEPFVADLTDAEELAAAWKRVEAEGLDVLVHSAGVAWAAEIGEADPAQWQRMFEINVFAVAELTRLALPALRDAGGQVIAINSGAGHSSRAGNGLYSGSKFALRAFTDALRDEESGRVRVTSIHPGRVDTSMQEQLQRSMGNDDYDGSIYVAPESVAATVRLAVDMPPESVVPELSIRPTQA